MTTTGADITGTAINGTIGTVDIGRIGSAAGIGSVTGVGDVLLRASGLVKRFGGVVATDNVDLDIKRGEIHALIGPNGAGKTTLVAQLGGQLASDHGRIVLDGADITREPAHRRARRGLARSFQLTRLFAAGTVHDNASLAAQAVSGSSFRAWRAARDERDLCDSAGEALAAVGLDALADRPVTTLTHGQRRALEVALALASRPRIVLLDEPMAGLGPEESVRMETLVATLRDRCAVFLIEHDVDAVFRLADRVSVLVSGRLIASGPPDVVRRDAAVVAAYLGEDAASVATA